MNLHPKNAEIVIGIVARIGVDTKAIVDAIGKELTDFKYTVHEIKTTSLLKAFKAKLNLTESPTSERYLSYIQACNKFREDIGNNAMALLSITEMVDIRQNSNSSKDGQNRVAFIINQIKRPEEFELLRSVYGEHYVQISCHSDEDERVHRLRRMITDDHPERPKDSQWERDARDLVSKVAHPCASTLCPQ